MGVKDIAPLDLPTVLAGRNAELRVGLSQYMDEINGRSGSGAEDLETMFQMLWLRFDGVRRDETVYTKLKGALAQSLQNLQASPNMRLLDATLDATFAPNPYKTLPLDPTQLERFDLDRSIALYRQRFASAKDLTFILVGDFDPDAIKPLVAAYLGTLPTPDLHVGFRDVGLRPVTGIVKKEIQVGIEPKSIVWLEFTGPAAWSPAEMQRMNALVDVLNLRVVAALREKRGLVYSGEVRGNVERIPYEHYSVDLVLPTAPDKADQVVAAVFAEIDSIRKDGPTQAELDKVKANWRQRHEQEMHENEHWMNQLQGALLDDTPASNMLTSFDKGQKLTVTDLRAAAQRYLDKDNYVQVVVVPEAKVQTASVAK
jgi:zinc protease